MPRSSKGGAFERDISRQLSLWWSSGQHDDWFWRTGGSGGRATNRAKSGKETVNGYGDIMAQCGEAQKLLDVVTIECKKGYNIVSISDLLDLKSGGTMQKFIDQATKAASLAGTPHWAIIHKRDRRETLLITNCLEFTGPDWGAQRLMLDDDILIAPLDLCLTPLTRSKLRDMR